MLRSFVAGMDIHPARGTWDPGVIEANQAVEEAGLPSVIIASLPTIAAQSGAPRVLAVDTPMGAALGVAALASGVGDYESAGALIGAAQRENDFGHVFEDADRSVYEHTMTTIRQQLGADGTASAIVAGRSLTLDAVATYLAAASGSLTPGRSSQVSQDCPHPE